MTLARRQNCPGRRQQSQGQAKKRLARLSEALTKKEKAQASHAEALACEHMPRARRTLRERPAFQSRHTEHCGCGYDCKKVAAANGQERPVIN